MYYSSKLKNTKDFGPFKNTLIYDIKLLGLGNIGGQKSVSNNFLFKTAQIIQLLFNPVAPTLIIQVIDGSPACIPAS